MMPRAGLLFLLASCLAGGIMPSEARDYHRVNTQRQMRVAAQPLPMHLQLNNINNRDHQLRAQIRSQLQTGQLTHSQAIALIVMLDQIKSTQKNYVGDRRLSQIESNALIAALGSVTDQLNAATNNPTARLNPSAMGFNMPNMGYPRGMQLHGRAISSVAPWWMF